MRSVWIISAITAFAVLTNSAWAQAAKNLTGTWVLVSVTTERPDSNKSIPWVQIRKEGQSSTSMSAI